jgi:hypothetical protein
MDISGQGEGRTTTNPSTMQAHALLGNSSPVRHHIRAAHGRLFERAFRLNLLVEGVLPVELKCTDRLAAVYEKQLLTYLRLMNRPVGLLINFGQYRLIDGVKRVANNYCPPDE